MPNQTIIEGLKMALHKGQSLQQAMMSFYNAGYKKQEIEEAARALHTEQDIIPAEHQVKHEPSKKPEKPKKPERKFKLLGKPLKIIKTPKIPQTKTNSQFLSKEQKKPKFFPSPKCPEGTDPALCKVSMYGEEEKTSSNKKLITIFLGLFLLCLIGVLVAAFFFKEQVVDFFNTLFD